MWCLEELCLGPQRLLRRGDCLLRGRVRRSTAARPAAFSNVLTPDRIPEFCIPPRLAPSPGLAALRNSWCRERDADDGAARTDWDPRSQAALSLPHLPRMRTAYGFCALLESPHTRRKESLLLGGSAAALLPRPRAHAHGAGGDATRAHPSLVPAAGPRALSDTFVPRPRGRCLLRAPDGLLGRTLRARKRDGPACARCVSGVHEAPPPWDPAAAPPPRPDRRRAEGTVTLERAGVALRLAAEYCPGSGHLCVRLLRADGPAGGAAEPRAVGCRVSFVLRPPGPTRRRRGAVVRRSRDAAVGQDFCFDGLTEDEVRRLAVRVKARPRGRGLERGRLRGRGELPLGPLLLL